MKRITHRFKPRLLITGLLALLVSGTAVLAHSDEWLAQQPSPHGGQRKMSGPYHFELLVNEDTLRAWVTDHGDNEIPTAGWTAEAVVLAAGKKTHVALQPAGGNTLEAHGALPAGTDTKLVLVVHPKPGESHSARFEFGAK